MFKDRLEKVLKAKKISQTELAESIGCSRQNVNDWLSGKSSPKYNNLVRLSAYLNVTIEELLSDEAKMMGIEMPGVKLDNVSPVAMSEECRELIKIYNSLSVLDKVKLLNHAFRLSGEKIAEEEENQNIIKTFVGKKILD